MTDRPQHFVADAAAFQALLAAVRADSRIALDTESNGFHAYFERVCLVQIATSGADWAVDPLALDPAPLVPLLSDPAREVVLHAAEYDVLCLKRDWGLTFGRIFDTHAAAKVLGLQRVGLGTLLADALGIELTIDEQRSDWGQRPLTPRQLEYAFADVRFLLPLRERLASQLEERKLLHEAEAEFARLVSKEPRPRAFDPEGWQRMKAARTLDGKGRAVLRELYLLRDRRAREVNRPAFKVLSDLFLAEVARRLPRSEAELEGVPGASSGALRKVSAAVLEAVTAGLASAPLAKPRGPGGAQQRGRKGAPTGPLSPEIEERYERLRRWRKGRAELRKVEVQIIAPNAVLWAIAKTAPSDPASLARVEGMDAFRVDNYGGEILDVLRAPAPSAAVREPAAKPDESATATEPDARPRQGDLFGGRGR